jgi:hypothetical protein
MSAPEESGSWYNRLTPPAANALAMAFSLFAGIAVALMLHYLLYRVGLPSRPFIYVAF